MTDDAGMPFHCEQCMQNAAESAKTMSEEEFSIAERKYEEVEKGHISWDSMVDKLRSEGYSPESANKISGYIKARSGHHEEDTREQNCSQCGKPTKHLPRHNREYHSGGGGSQQFEEVGLPFTEDRESMKSEEQLEFGCPVEGCGFETAWVEDPTKANEILKEHIEHIHGEGTEQVQGDGHDAEMGQVTTPTSGCDACDGKGIIPCPVCSESLNTPQSTPNRYQNIGSHDDAQLPEGHSSNLGKYPPERPDTEASDEFKKEFTSTVREFENLIASPTSPGAYRPVAPVPPDTIFVTDKMVDTVIHHVNDLPDDGIDTTWLGDTMSKLAEIGDAFEDWLLSSGAYSKEQYKEYKKHVKKSGDDWMT